MTTQQNNEWGDIPEDWEVVALGEILEYAGSGRTNTNQVGNFILYGSTGVIGTCQKAEYSGNAILVARVGANAGKVSFVTGQYGVSDNAIILKTKETINIKFILNFLKFSKLNELIFGSGQPLITGSQLKSLKIPLPPKPEQTVIATVLSDTDKLIDSLTALIAKKQAIKSATMNQLLSGQKRLPQFAHHSDGTPKGYLKTEHGIIPEDWEVVALGDLATFLKGNGLSKKDIQELGKYPAVHYGELFVNYKEKIDKVISFTNTDYPVKSVRNDVLMPTSDVTPNGLATASCIQLDNVILGGDILVIRIPFEKINGVFFAYFIRFDKENILRKVKGTTVFHLYAKDMAELKILIPKSLTEQTAIAQILSDMDSEITALESRLAKTRALKQGLMHQLLTGKIRLSDNPSNAS